MHVHRDRAVARLLPFFASTLLLAGCAFILPAKKPPVLEEERRQFYLDRGGPEALRDVEAVTAKLGGYHALETGCIDDYMSALGLEQDKKETPVVKNEELTINRYDSCAKQCSQQAQSGLPDIAHKYEQLCTTRGRALKEQYFLTELRKDIEKLRAAPDPIHLMVAARGVDHNVEVTKASLGQDDPMLKALLAERDTVLKSRAGDVEKERAFRELRISLIVTTHLVPWRPDVSRHRDRSEATLGQFRVPGWSSRVFSLTAPLARCGERC